MKTVLAIAAFLIVFLFACAHQPGAGPAPIAMAERESRVVLVEAFCVESDPFLSETKSIGVSTGRGSGVLLGDGRILTALHVVDCPYLLDAHVTTLDKRRHRATIARSWPDRDLALLAVDIRARELATAVAQPGSVLCSGYAVPSRGAACGRLDNVEAAPSCHAGGGNGKRWCRDASWFAVAAPGNSGGPLWDGLGHLVGIVTGGSNLLGVPVEGGFASTIWQIRGELAPSARR